MISYIFLFFIIGCIVVINVIGKNNRSVAHRNDFTSRKLQDLSQNFVFDYIDQKIDENYLLRLREHIIQTKSRYFEKHPIRCKLCAAFRHDWTDYIQNKPILILSGYAEGNFGNSVGMLLTTIACANVSGAHAILLDPQPNDPVFWKTIPKVIVHNHPASNYSMIRKMYQWRCHADTRVPWEDDRRWIHPGELIHGFRPIMNNSIRNQMEYQGYFTKQNTTILLPSQIPLSGDESYKDVPDLRQVLTDSEKSSISQYPDVIIHYHCLDHITFPNMGLLSFYSIIDHIPPNQKYIFLIAEDLKVISRVEERHKHRVQLCLQIENELIKEIQQHHPHSHVVMRRSGNYFETYDMFMNSKVVICSASTFCFYGATSNSIGQVYLPKRPFYNSYINIDNVHTMNDISIYEWYDNGKKMEEKDLTADIVLNILRNRSYTFPTTTNTIVPCLFPNIQCRPYDEPLYT